MLSEETLTHFSTLTYRPDAKRQVCILPLGSVYWDDELPQMGKFAAFPEPDRNEILRVFALRLKLWDRQVLSDEDRQFWESVRSAAPNWAIFPILIGWSGTRLNENAQRNLKNFSQVRMKFRLENQSTECRAFPLRSS
jgi:hypothetical protein